LLPGGLATAVSAIICGRLLGGANAKIDPRVMILFGVAIFMFSMWQLGHMTAASGQDDTRVALLIRGFGLGFLFTPINQMAYASLKPNEVQQASGLINLSRQLGGSFGIAILGTYLQRHITEHRADLVTNLYAGNGLMDQRLQAMAGNFMAHGYSPDQAQKAAYAALDLSVQKQALTMSYGDGFLLILLIFACTVPAVFILRKPKARAGAPADAH
jgi:DHA2 family multidrug resistance protein